MGVEVNPEAEIAIEGESDEEKLGEREKER